MPNFEKDTEDFWWYARQWRTQGDRLAFQALLEMKNRSDLHPSLMKRIVEIETNEDEASRSLRSSSVA